MSGLVVKRAGKEEYGSAVKILVAGDPGSGKTPFASTAPGVLYAATYDAGLMSVVDKRPPFVDIAKIEDLELLRVALAQKPEKRQEILGVEVDTIVVDTLDGIQRLLIEERKKETRKDQMTIQDFGWLGDQLRAIIRGFKNLPMHVIFTVHVRSTEEAETGRTYVKPQLQGAIADEVAAYFDVVCLLKATPTTKVVDGETRRVVVRTAQTTPDASHSWLRDRSGRLPQEFELNFQNDFEKIIRSMFGNDVNIPVTETAATIVDERPPEKPAKASGSTKKAAAKKQAQQELDVPDPEPEAEPAAPEPETEVPEPVVEPEAVVEEAPEPQPEPEPVEEPEEPTPSAEPADDMTCETCGGEIETEDQRDLSILRFRAKMCRTCFVEKKRPVKV